MNWRKIVLGFLLAAAPAALAAEVSTVDTGHVQNPRWSPDGNWLAFEINNMSNSVQLWLTKVSGAAPGSPVEVKIPGSGSSFGAGGYMAASPTWATKPSLMLVFEGSSPGGTMRLYYATPGAGAPNELLSSTQIQGNLSSPTMAPSGQRFAFVSDKTGLGDVYVWELKDGKINAAFVSDTSENFPAWDPSSQKLVFSRKNQGTEDLYMWSGSPTTTPLKGGNGDQTRPTFVGDQVVYFTSERGDGHWDIAVSGQDGSRTILAKDVRLPARAAPAVTPDNQWVAYGVEDPTKQDRIVFSRVDGSRTVEIPTGLVACGEPAVVSSSGRLLLAFTALPAEGSDWRRLHVLDITGKL